MFTGSVTYVKESMRCMAKMVMKYETKSYALL